MAAGPIGAAWASGSWADTSWQEDSWGDSGGNSRRLINARRRRRCAIAMYARRRRF